MVYSCGGLLLLKCSPCKFYLDENLKNLSEMMCECAFPTI